MRIALGQIRIIWEDKEANLRKAEACLKLLREQGTDLFLLPEMSFTGFSMETDRTKETEKETVKAVHMLAEKYGITIGAGWVKDAGARCENHYSIVSPKGEILDYAKLHPFSYSKEDQYFQGGKRLSVCTVNGMDMGVQICYDLRFPEPFQILSKEADLIVVPANWPAARREHWMCLLRARAIENAAYVAGINCAGQMGGQYYSGDSALYGPDGSALFPKRFFPDESCPEEQILWYELENDVRMYREHFPVKKDRRETLYKILAGGIEDAGEK